MKTHPEYQSRFRILKGGKISLVVSALLGSMTLSFAAPSGGVVTSGNANISHNGSVTNINQSTHKASINWQSFSVASHETVNFNQPNSSSITLNRVIGHEKSIINGALNANGQVWILNSNGVLFGKNASINTAGLLATTAKLSDTDFQNGNYNFIDSSANSVINEGTITISDGGSVILASNEVRNSGVIEAIKGKVHLVGADSYSLNLNGNSLVNLKIEKGVLDALVENSGTIIANGGEIYLTTNAVDELLKGIVNNTGIIEANSIDGLTGHVELFAHGGEIQVGGSITALDGFVETSGKIFNIKDGTKIQAGHWLIDPMDVTINETLATTLEGQLAIGDASIEASHHGIGSDDGNIYVNSAITWSTAQKLTLDAYNDIFINEVITATHANGQLALYYGQENVENGNNANYYVNSVVNLQAGDNFFTKLGFDVGETTWKVITALGSEGSTTGTDLQGISGNLSSKYVLGANIDASATSTWDSGAGFDPIGTLSSSGVLDGLGHTISDLYINRENTSNVGLFSQIDGTVQNLGIIESDITGASRTGGLAGRNRGTITNSYVSGEIFSFGASVGGLTGENTGTIRGSHFSGIVEKPNTSIGNYAGGLTGVNTGTISNSYSSGEITQNSSNSMQHFGGLVGSNEGTITDSHSSMNITATKGLGGLVGYNNGGTISNSYATGDVTSTGANFLYSAWIGGLVGISFGAIENSYATGDVTGIDSVGGFIGESDDVITNSYATGNVSGTTKVGGFAGVDYGTTSYSYATGNVVGTSQVGGFAGYSEGFGISYSYATGKVTSTDTWAGGFVGENYTDISNSYATGDVVGVNSVGGFVGDHYDQTISNVYSTGKVTGTGNAVGGLAGYNGGTIENSFWDTQKSTQASSAAGEGKTTAQMKNIATFTDAGWTITEDSSGVSKYPYIENGTWKIGAVPTVVSSSTTSSNSSSTTNSEEVNKVVTAISNTSAIKVDIPKVKAPQVNNPAPRVQSQTTMATNMGLGNARIVSTTTAGENPNKVVSLGELQQANGQAGEVRVPIGKNSIVDLVNGGVNLPNGVEQQFFVIANNTATEN